jgi:predicted nucleic acid-binding protein
MSRESADEAIRSFSDLNLPTTSSIRLLPHAFVIAASFERTVYDSIYVALAVTTNRSLVTADERLANSLAAHFPIRWLGSIA